MKVLLALLLVAFIPASGQLLSDKTGLVNVIDVNAGGLDFEVQIVGNFDVAGHELDSASKRLLVILESSLNNNVGEIILPRGLLGGNLTLYSNGEQIAADVRYNEQISFVTFEFEGEGRNELEIFGTLYLGVEQAPESDMPEEQIPYWWAAIAIIPVVAAGVWRWMAQK